MTGLLCHRCGFNNPPGMRFCGNCGTRLGVDTSTLMASAATKEYIPETVGVMIGSDLMERFRVAGLNAAGQRRTVSILFADLSGFTVLSQQLDTEEVFLIIQQFMNVLIKDVYKYDGIVDKMLGDGLMAIFGAPIAHGNHPELALRAANEMMIDIRQFSHQIREKYSDKLNKEIQLSLHIALNSGEVIVGGIGSNMMMNYTAIGDTVNLTSRLLDAADPGVILVSRAVHQRVKNNAEFRPAGPFWLKGYEKPVTAYQFVRMFDQDSSEIVLQLRSPMVGRNKQLLTLVELVDQVRTSKHGSMAFVYGEAGIGKSRLMTEFRTSLNEMSIISVVGHCFTYKKSIQYWVLQDILRHYLNLNGNESLGELRQIASKHVKPKDNYTQDETVSLLLWLFGSLPKNEFQKNRFSYLNPEQLQREIFILARDILFSEAAQAPLVFIFEDMHWADDSSLQFITFLSKSIKDVPILVVANTRSIQDEIFSNLINSYKKELGNQLFLIEVNRLSGEDARFLIDNLLKPHELPDALFQKITHLGNGNPYFIEELIRSLAEQGFIHFDETWKVIPDKKGALDFDIPDTLQGLILSRFDRLSEVQRRLLQVASIIGRDFNSNILRDVLKIGDPSFFDEVLQQLVNRGILEKYSNFTGQDYRFTHILMSDTIYGTLMSGDKSELHGMIANTIEKYYPDHIDDHLDVLARHYSYSYDKEKALNYCILAAKQSADKYANIQAIKYYRHAENILSTTTPQYHQVADVYTGLGSLQVFRGEYQNALESYRKAASSLQKAACNREDNEKLARLYRLISEVYEKLSHYEEAIDYLTKAQNILILNGTLDPMELVWQLHDLGWIQFRQGHLADAESTLQNGLNNLDENKQPVLYASLCNHLASVYFQQGRYSDAIQKLERSISFREKIGDKIEVARTNNSLGLLQWKLGHWDIALEIFTKSLKGFKTLGDVEGEVDILSNLGKLLIDRGDFTQADECLGMALKQSNALNLTYHSAIICSQLSKLCYLTQKYDQGLEFSCTGIDLLESIHSKEGMAELKIYEGMIWLGKGDIHQARICGDQAVRFADEMDSGNKITEDRGKAYRLLAIVALHEKEIDRAMDCLVLSDEIFQHTGDVMEQARNLVVQSNLAKQVGDAIRSNSLKLRARQIFDQYGAKAELLALKKN
jgi:predicted ATPase/class 3 adenylate cyclase